MYDLYVCNLPKTIKKTINGPVKNMDGKKVRPNEITIVLNSNGVIMDLIYKVNTNTSWFEIYIN